MSTFVELAQELRRLCGIQGSGPTDVETATGIELELANYIKNAWIDIQTHPKQWRWMIRDWYQSGTTPLQTADDTNDYVIQTGVDMVEAIMIDTFRSYFTATGTTDRQRMLYVAYRKFQNAYSVVTAANERPIMVTRTPNDRLRFHPQPDGIYSIEFEHFKTPQILVTNTDVPEMPARHHQLIVYEGLKRFGNITDAPELIRSAEAMGGNNGGDGKPVNGMWRELIWDQEVRENTDQRADTAMVVTTQQPGEPDH